MQVGGSPSLVQPTLSPLFSPSSSKRARSWMAHRTPFGGDPRPRKRPRPSSPGDDRLQDHDNNQPESPDQDNPQDDTFLALIEPDYPPQGFATHPTSASPAVFPRPFDAAGGLQDELIPDLPNRLDRSPFIVLENAFEDNAEERIRDLNHLTKWHLENGELNGYLKIRIKKPALHPSASLDYPSFAPIASGHGAHKVPAPPLPEPSPLPRASPRSLVVELPARDFVPNLGMPHLPANFGLNMSMNDRDRHLFLFYRGPWSRGRTILEKTNCWLISVAQMAPESECVRHAILALSSIYVLDFAQNDTTRQGANRHYREAVKDLSRLLEDPKQQEPGHGEALVAAITLLNMLDVISPQQRRSRDQIPRWLEGARLGVEILSKTDLGYHYHQRINVQPSAARVGNMITVARAAIIALPVTPLDLSNTEGEKFQWLLYGNERELSQIHGCCGFSPRLLYMLSHITHLAACLQDHPDSIMVPVGAQEHETLLNNLDQWSELGNTRYRSTNDLLNSCQVNSSGCITTRLAMTDLTAEAWRLAAIIYLRCRVFRLPRDDPMVALAITDLGRCIRIMPTVGELFTAQAPFFPVFLLGLVSFAPEDTRIAEHWFTSVIQKNTCRSVRWPSFIIPANSTGVFHNPFCTMFVLTCRVLQSVPPAWEALPRIQEWMINHRVGLGNTDEILETKICDRNPWWETMVARIMETEGTLCLI